MAMESKKLFYARRQEAGRFEFANDRVIVDIMFDGVLAVDIPGLAQSGERLEITGRSEFEFRDGKIVRVTDVK